MCWWHWTAKFSLNLHIFCRLSRKVCWWRLQGITMTYLMIRVLIANIHNLGACPCPCCTIPKDRIRNLATERDMLQWWILVCKDTKDRHDKISAARHLIYEQHFIVDTPGVKALLKEESMVPTKVSARSVPLHHSRWFLYVECLFWEASSPGVWLFYDARCWSFTWIWTWCLEGGVYPLIENLGWHEGKQTCGAWSAVGTLVVFQIYRST